MQPIAIQSARAPWVGYLVASLAFAVAAVVVVARNASSPVGWLGLVVFTATTFVAVRQLLDRRPRITIDDKGIVDRTLRYGLVEWSDIEGASLERRRGVFINLQVRDPKKYTDRLPPRFQRGVPKGPTPVPLNLTWTDVNPEAVLHQIEDEVRTRLRAQTGAAT